MIKDNTVPYDDEAFLQKREAPLRSALSISPDGQWMALVVQGLASGAATSSGELNSGADEAEPLLAISEEMGGSEVVIVEICTGQVQRPFRGFNASFWPVWSPNGSSLALLTQSAERSYPRLTLWSLENSTPRVFTAPPASVLLNFQALRWTRDCRRVVFMALAPDSAEKPLVQRMATIESNDLATSDQLAEVLDMGGCRQSLAVVDVTTGQSATFGRMVMTWGWRLAPDDQRVAFLRYAQPLDAAVNHQSNWRQLVVVDLSDGSEQLIGDPQTDNWGCSFNWSPDGRAIAWVAAAHHSATKLLVAETSGDMTGGHVRDIALPEGTYFGFYSLGWYPPPAPLWNQNGSAFYLPGKARLWRFTRDGTSDETLTLPEGTAFDWLSNSIAAHDFPRTAIVDEDKDLLIFRPREVWKVNWSSQTATLWWQQEQDAPSLINNCLERACDVTRSTLYSVHVSAEGTITLNATTLASGERRVVSTVFQGVGEFEAGPIHTLSWTLPDGTECAGSVLLPAGWSQGDKPPVVMIVYGDQCGRGDLSAADFHETYIADAHLLSAHGYAVIVPDMPQTDEQPAASLVMAGEAAAYALRESGLADADRIVVMGQSYGAYTTLCLLTGSKMFKAGIAANGTYDLFRSATDGGWGWAETGQGRIHASLWENPARYLENSPLHALDKLEAPLIILQGGADGALDQAKALFSASRRLDKKDVEMLIYRDGGHGVTSWSIAAQRDWHRRLLAFLNEHLRAQPADP